MYLGLAMPLALGLALRDRRPGLGGPLVGFAWLATVAGGALFTARIYPTIQAFRGAESFSSPGRAAVLAVASLVLVAALGWFALRGRESAWPAGLDASRQVDEMVHTRQIPIIT